MGVRTALVPNVQLAASLWTLKLDSLLGFPATVAPPNPSRASRREGIELGAFYSPVDWVVVDADLAWTKARYTDPTRWGDRIPNAVERVVSLGVSVNRKTGAGSAVYACATSAQHPSSRTTASGSTSTLIVNGDAGHHFSPRFSVAATVFNLLDADDNDITYFYESQLQGGIDAGC